MAYSKELALAEQKIAFYEEMFSKKELEKLNTHMHLLAVLKKVRSMHGEIDHVNQVALSNYQQEAQDELEGIITSMFKGK